MYLLFFRWGSSCLFHVSARLYVNYKRPTNCKKQTDLKETDMNGLENKLKHFLLMKQFKATKSFN